MSPSTPGRSTRWNALAATSRTLPFRFARPSTSTYLRANPLFRHPARYCRKQHHHACQHTKGAANEAAPSSFLPAPLLLWGCWRRGRRRGVGLLGMGLSLGVGLGIAAWAYRVLGVRRGAVAGDRVAVGVVVGGIGLLLRGHRRSVWQGSL